MDISKKIFTPMCGDKGGNLQGLLLFLWPQLGSMPLETCQELAFRVLPEILASLPEIIILHTMCGALWKYKC